MTPPTPHAQPSQTSPSQTSPSPTGIPELDGVLAELVDRARDALGDDFVGVYLQGSFALGDADAESDCDFLVVTGSALSDEQLAPLRAFHAELPHRPGTWNRHLEGSYAPVGELADLDAVGRPWQYVDHGHDTLGPDPHCNTEVTRWILRHHGVRLAGSPPESLLPAVPAAALQARMAAEIPDAVQAWERQERWLAWDARYAPATMARMWFTQVHGEVVSKKTAMRWLAARPEGSEWAALLEAAALARGGPYDAPVADEEVAAVRRLVRAVGRWSADLATG
ncbi:nucleotidyltransferase domain-containing protein [Phycicoccus sp. Soil748]|uniref:nucleotidyltransferase domain-containing protein n=1 Tax=Phycicoccus sp. Soil748 TaxID=1736397 RepID=UPI000703780C|nr:nucleotidyltransferase domain-containing protein [Phycicoccus sp. Soil748]KRE54539.1 hypothetical protein ASG70_10205 [Phycicoccus sp. Soil748]